MQLLQTDATITNIDLLLTEICKVHARTGSCMYGENCRFAHGLLELRFVKRHPRYKTRKCVNFWNRGYCAYGDRCCFIHNELPRPEVHSAGPPLDHATKPVPLPTATMPQTQPSLSLQKPMWTDQTAPTHPIWASESADTNATATWKPAISEINPWGHTWPNSSFPPSTPIPVMQTAAASVDALVTNFERTLGDIPMDREAEPDQTRSYAAAASPP